MATAHDEMRIEFEGGGNGSGGGGSGTLTVVGGGSNVFGQFSVEGKFYLDTKRLVCTKAYDRPMHVPADAVSGGGGGASAAASRCECEPAGMSRTCQGCASA